MSFRPPTRADKTDKRKYTLRLCIDEINGPLLKLGFKIATCFSEVNGAASYCLVNTLDDREAVWWASKVESAVDAPAGPPPRQTSPRP